MFKFGQVIAESAIVRTLVLYAPFVFQPQWEAYCKTNWFAYVCACVYRGVCCKEKLAALFSMTRLIRYALQDDIFLAENF